MFWPRLILTPEEQRVASKYFDPLTNKPGVMHRMYSGQIETNETERRPIWAFQIARRCRVFAMTAIGDVNQMRIQLQDASGEQYNTQPALATTLFGGWANSAAQGTNTGLPLTAGLPSVGMLHGVAPYVLEPNIVLKPNQVLNLIGNPVRLYADQAYRMDVTLHVWEFPNWPKKS